MTEIDTSIRENIPFTDTQLTDIIKDIQGQLDKSTLTKEKGIKRTHIFDKTNTDNLVGGFQITMMFILQENDKVAGMITELLIFDTDDEWLEAYSAITKKQKN